MKLPNRLFALHAVALVFAAGAMADTKTIEGRGMAEGPRGVRAEFAVNVRKVDENRPEGRFTVTWSFDNAQITVSLAQPPAMLEVVEKTGRFSGLAVKTVRTAQGTRQIRGRVYVTCVDHHDPNNPGQRKDHLTVRFVRDVWGHPEGDEYFAGVVVRGDLSVAAR
jgi:hypothetical protein